MKLMGSSMSPFVERVRLTLALKGQENAVELAELPGGMKSTEHLALAPMGRIPVFQTDSGVALTESQAIAEYLDDVLEGPKLAPADPIKKAQVSIFCRIVDLDFLPSFIKLWPGRADEAAVKEAIDVGLPKALDYLEFAAGEGGLLADGEPTLADAALAPFLFHIRVFGKKQGFENFGDRPLLSGWQDRMSASAMGQASFERSSEALNAFMARQS